MGLFSRHEGRICGTAGDSILAAFGSALAAVQCAVDIQNELARSNNDLEKDRRMQFRIGINVGDVMLKDGDICGDGVNIAARLEGLADPGGICISRGIHDHEKNCRLSSNTSASKASRISRSPCGFTGCSWTSERQNRDQTNP
jgi:class 3 adenylate cyclase